MEKETQKLAGLNTVTKNAGWWLPHEKICWISERHNVLNRNAQGQLHKDGGLACGYPDGWGVYALNGIRMKPEYVLIPAGKLEPKVILAETNTEVRRELLRKIGIERFLSVAKHKVLDRHGDYEMLSIELTPEITDARYLKMVNPSIGCFHMEGCPPECDTVEKAMNFRNSNWFTHAEILT